MLPLAELAGARDIEPVQHQIGVSLRKQNPRLKLSIHPFARAALPSQTEELRNSDWVVAECIGDNALVDGRRKIEGLKCV